jgi:PleD family two-component response regulator
MNELGYIESLKRRILIVDDEEINREILGHILEQNYEIAYADNGETAMSMLEDGGGRFSLILLDLLMPVMDGFALLERIRANEQFSGIPVIVMTSEKPAEVRSIKLGADDFITKPYDMPEVILARCERIIQLYEDKSIIRSAEKDDLTGLYTREFFQEYVTRIDTYVGNRPMDAVVCNIEHFHMLNEMYGRKKGDRVLQATAAALFSLLGPEDIIGSRPDADY